MAERRRGRQRDGRSRWLAGCWDCFPLLRMFPPNRLPLTPFPPFACSAAPGLLELGAHAPCLSAPQLSPAQRTAILRSA